MLTCHTPRLCVASRILPDVLWSEILSFVLSSLPHWIVHQRISKSWRRRVLLPASWAVLVGARCMAPYSRWWNSIGSVLLSLGYAVHGWCDLEVENLGWPSTKLRELTLDYPFPLSERLRDLGFLTHLEFLQLLLPQTEGTLGLPESLVGLKTLHIKGRYTLASRADARALLNFPLLSSLVIDGYVTDAGYAGLAQEIADNPQALRYLKLRTYGPQHTLLGPLKVEEVGLRGDCCPSSLPYTRSLNLGWRHRIGIEGSSVLRGACCLRNLQIEEVNSVPTVVFRAIVESAPLLETLDITPHGPCRYQQRHNWFRSLYLLATMPHLRCLFVRGVGGGRTSVSPARVLGPCVTEFRRKNSLLACWLLADGVESLCSFYDDIVVFATTTPCALTEMALTKEEHVCDSARSCPGSLAASCASLVLTLSDNLRWACSGLPAGGLDLLGTLAARQRSRFRYDRPSPPLTALDLSHSTDLRGPEIAHLCVMAGSLRVLDLRNCLALRDADALKELVSQCTNIVHVLLGGSGIQADVAHDVHRLAEKGDLIVDDWICHQSPIL